jgi:hypothetical protein
MKAAAYARYSSDNQREESIDAQLRYIVNIAKRNNMQLVKIYTDEARSATTDDRPGFLQMIQDSSTGPVLMLSLCINWIASAGTGMTVHFINASSKRMVSGLYPSLKISMIARNQSSWNPSWRAWPNITAATWPGRL